MTDQISIQIPKGRIKEGSAFTATAYFRDRATEAASAPAAIKYRLDCLTTGREVLSWTSATPGATASIAVTATQNVIQDQSNRYERKQLTVAANPDTSGQIRESVIYEIENIRGF